MEKYAQVEAHSSKLLTGFMKEVSQFGNYRHKSQSVVSTRDVITKRARVIFHFSCETFTLWRKRVGLTALYKISCLSILWRICLPSFSRATCPNVQTHGLINVWYLWSYE